MKLYYIQNRGVVGNCALWWAEGGHGYTCNLDEAWKVDEKKARSICADRPKEDFAWSVESVDRFAQRHFDVQRFDDGVLAVEALAGPNGEQA